MHDFQLARAVKAEEEWLEIGENLLHVVQV
jgi:hypothetical protein